MKKPFQWLVNKIQKYQVITFTIAFLFVHRWVTLLINYFANKEQVLEIFYFNTWLLLMFFSIILPAMYFLAWLVMVLVASMFTATSLKEKFFQHPIATIILSIFFIIDLLYRIFLQNNFFDSGAGGLNLVNALGGLIYYVFWSFLWWLLVCWISKKISKKQKYKWGWYRKMIDWLFVFFPTFYKIILSLTVVYFIFILLFLLIAEVFNYSGADIKTLINP